jgi:L,D-peptidoglycan transpeptidase YkuD (ErfK/YbiS/YcfS/YnhG family)
VRSSRTLAALGLLAVAGCQQRSVVAVPPVTPTPSAVSSARSVAVRSATPAATRRPAPTPTRQVARPAPRPAPPAPPTCPTVPDVGRAAQVVLVDSSGSAAVVRACQRTGASFRSVLGVMYGHVGINGVAPPGAKREGDLRTPGGVFTLGQGFGVQPDPGVVFGWRRTDSADVWVDDPGSALYNTWQRNPADGRWQHAESLYQPVPYGYAQIVDYNTARVPGLGSAIFLHVDIGGPTAGCVSLPQRRLLAVLRWLRPSDHPRITISVKKR